MRKLSFILLLWTGIFRLYGQSVTARLDSLVSSSALLQTSEVGISVFNLTKGEPVYTYQDQKLYRPASIEKVITSVTALDRLGESYTFDTRLAYTGAIGADSVLQGNLYVVGGFDPEFMEDDLRRLTDAVHRAGINRVRGNLVADVSAMDSIYWGTGWAWDDTPNAFQPYLSPLMLNRGCVNVSVKPGQKGSRPEVEVFPRSDYYAVDNRAVSHIPHIKPLEITRDWLYNGNTIHITGNASRATGRTLNMFASQEFFIHTFRYQLAQEHIAVDSVKCGICPEEATLLYKVSRPLEEVLKRALKKSDNLSAEALFYHLAIRGSENKGIGAEDAQKAVKRFMRQAIGKNPDAYSIVDGSGVSMYNYVSPDLMLAYLKYAYSQKDIFAPFYEALPVAGVDGTLRYRMRKGKTFRNVHAKTGTVKGVSSLAGYVQAGNGDMLAFVIINQNVMNGRKARLFQDKICEILAQ